MTVIAIFFCTASNEPGLIALPYMEIPFSFAFSKALGSSTSAANIFTLIPSYVTALNFVLGFGNQWASIANSGLFPPFL
jgi:hypothetical protein